jgi:hypothetical protein
MICALLLRKSKPDIPFREDSKKDNIKKSDK